MGTGIGGKEEKGSKRSQEIVKEASEPKDGWAEPHENKMGHRSLSLSFPLWRFLGVLPEGAFLSLTDDI